MTLTKDNILENDNRTYREDGSVIGYSTIPNERNKARQELASKVADELSRIVSTIYVTNNGYNKNEVLELKQLIKTLRGNGK